MREGGFRKHTNVSSVRRSERGQNGVCEEQCDAAESKKRAPHERRSVETTLIDKSRVTRDVFMRQTLLGIKIKSGAFTRCVKL